MKHRENSSIIIGGIVCLLPMLVGMMLYAQLPDMLPTHWNFSGEVDGYTRKALAVYGMPVMLCGFHLLMHFIVRNDPKKAGVPKIMRNFSLWIIPAMSVLLMGFTYLVSLGVAVPIQRVVPALVGVMFVVIGNYMPKCRQNYHMGYKLPWTLNSEENWNLTHRLAGYFWTVGGLLLTLGGILGWGGVAFFVTMALVMVPSFYSYRLYKKGI